MFIFVMVKSRAQIPVFHYTVRCFSRSDYKNSSLSKIEEIWIISRREERFMLLRKMGKVPILAWRFLKVPFQRVLSQFILIRQRFLFF